VRTASLTAPDRTVVTARTGRWSANRVIRDVCLAITAALLITVLGLVAIGAQTAGWFLQPGGDFIGYMSATHGWLAGDGFYPSRQLQGPYLVQLGDVLYPPTALYLFIPFTFLPAILWWVVPIGLTGWLFWRWRPSIIVWPLMAAGLAYPESPLMLIRGTPTIWVMLAVAAGLEWGWPGALVLLKPSMLPFAVTGVRSRGWWLVLSVLIIATLPVLPMIPDWILVMRDARGPASGLLYSLKDVPLVAIPLIAWAGRTRAS
jgi:hypothetical protein